MGPALPPDSLFDSLDRLNVVWNTPSKDAAGSMPLGNGEVVLNTWVEETTGDILVLFGRTDSLSEISRILKIGRVRVHFSPRKDWHQTLDLKSGRIFFDAGSTRLRLLVDSQRHTIHLAGGLGDRTQVRVSVENWRDKERALPDSENVSAWSALSAPFPRIESADKFLAARPSRVRWVHENLTSIVPKLVEEQSLQGLKGLKDLLLNRRFGAEAHEPSLRADGTSLSGESDALDLTIATHSAQTKTLKDWERQLDRVAAPTAKAEARTVKWWGDFWQRSYVFVRGDESVERAYVLQRYLQACQGRGAFPIKFNGGYFTVEPTAMGLSNSNPDFRKWGDSHWYQNGRHMYHPMLASGDFDLMEPFFRLYERTREHNEARTKFYYGAKGVYFPETMTIHGTYSGGDYGWDRKGLTPGDIQCPWWQWAWNQGPELVHLMLDRWDYTRDERFLKQRVLPMAESVLTYFDTRFKKDAAGRIVLDPTQSVETYWSGVINDTPTTAGLIAITNRLTKLPEHLVDSKLMNFFGHMQKACPELPIANGMIQPAQKFKPERSNVENPEQYATWPFGVVSLANPTYLAEAKAAYAKRANHLDTGWGYDGVVATMLGMTDEAKRILKVKCANSHKAYRWPATWGPNFDWIPDQNHGGNILNQTQLMLLQSDPLELGGAIRLLPSWPKDWDVEFKLRAAGNTTVECVFRGGKVEKLEVTPKSRRKDVVLP